MAACKAPPERYDLVDLGDVVEGQAESRAVAIDERGRVIVRAIPPGIGQAVAEYVVSPSGKAQRVENPDAEARRETISLVGDRIRVTDYTLIKTGFLPARTTTLIDRKGGEIDIETYCPAPENSDWELDEFVISDDGEEAVGLFTSGTRSMVAKCAFEEETETLFETRDALELGGINNDGDIGGLLKSEGDLFLWRWSDGERVSDTIPNGLLNVDVSGIDRDGRVYAVATGEVVSPAIYLDEDAELSPAIVLPGEGWDVGWVTVGPCGMLIGEATYTNFATFIQLPAEEQYRMRQNFSEFWQYALERETELFVWSANQRNGKFLGSVAKDTRDWSSLRITAINEDGIAVGYADNEIGETRAIKLIPSKD